ncbi:hypothetical protein NHQ30_001461 [Ciborinia camelliae]|nr:hypothetical protein NHQ30_001461 [Ciborinia camelliae]
MASSNFQSKRTTFGRRYGAFANGKSRLTPVTPYPHALSLISDDAASSWLTRHEIEEYQRSILRSYTTRILKELDAITERDLESSSLSNPILPCLRRSQWETRENMVFGVNAEPYVSDGRSLGLEQDVVWLAENDLVWNELAPILRLASWIIVKISKTPWALGLDLGFDAMMMSERADVPRRQFKADTLLNHRNEGFYQIRNEFTQVRLRPYEIIAEGKAEALMHILINEVLVPRMKLALISETIDPSSRQPESETRSQSRRLFAFITHHPDQTFSLSLCYEQIAPLLSKNLNDAERLAEQFGCATNIVHELMHVLNKAKVHYYDPINEDNFGRWHYEPYFEDESSSELGFSAISNFFGGYADGFIRFIPIYEAPQMGFFLTSFPGSGEALSDLPTLKSSSQEKTPSNVSVPLPVTYYEALSSNHFWEQHVTAFGMINPSEEMGQAIYTQPHGWRRMQADEEEFAKQMRISLLQSKSQDTPSARHESLISTIHHQKIVAYQILDIYLKARSLKVMDQSEWLIKSSKNQYEGYASDFADMLDDMEEVMSVHEKIIEFIPKMDKHATAALLDHETPDARKAARIFHRDFSRFMNSLGSSKIPEFQMRMQKMRKIIERLEHLSGTVEFLNSWTMSESGKLDDLRELEKIIEIGEAFHDAKKYENGDETKCEELCNEVLEGMGYSLYAQAQARVYKSRLSTTVTLEANALLRRASETFDLIHDGTIPMSQTLWSARQAEHGTGILMQNENSAREELAMFQFLLAKIRREDVEKLGMNAQICYTRAGDNSR